MTDIFCRSWTVCYLCLVFVMLLRMFIAVFWSPAGRALTLWLSFVMFHCVLSLFNVVFWVRYLIVSNSDICCLSYLTVDKAQLHVKQAAHI